MTGAVSEGALTSCPARFSLCSPTQSGYAASMSADRKIENLALIGFMGVGKSAVGRLAAMHLRFDFVDTDDWIEKRAGKSIARIFAEDGETAFREMERQLVADMAGWRHRVIATGGGLAANPANLQSMRQHALVVCLWATAEAIFARVRSQAHRPLLHGPDPQAKIRALLEERAPVYKQADVLVNTAYRNVPEVVQQVLHQFNEVRHRPSGGDKPHAPTRH